MTVLVFKKIIAICNSFLSLHVHPRIFQVEFFNKIRFPGLPILWVVAGDLLQDGELHVVDVVTREVEVGPGGLVQPLVPHVAKVFCPSLFCCVLSFSNILESALAALHDVDQVLVLTGVVSGQLHSGGGGRGLDHLGCFDVGAGPARSPTFPHTPKHPQDCPLRSSRGWRGQLGSDEFVSDVLRPLVCDQRREREHFLHLRVGDHRPPMFFHECRDAGQARVIIHHEH